jgi:peptidyl-prolyl cis-trans isomerase B (cyclophilin B)
MLAARPILVSQQGRRSTNGVLLVFLLIAQLGLVGCTKKMAVKDFDTANKPGPTEANIKTGVKPIADAEVAVIETADFGTIVIELYPNVAPKFVARFKKLIADGFYNGTTFHRVDPSLGLIQGGDPLSKDNDPANDGTGDSNEPNLPAEFSDIPFERGSVGAARRGAAPAGNGQPALSEEQARDTANCQFFITLNPQPDFDEDYTLFGRVIQGINNAEVIMRAPSEEETARPNERIAIKSITLKPRSPYVTKID